ncbi:MAG TPA: hypothetical protein VNH22_13680, partial [Blastocatellia bacterium]|nr:hypothetical protein [Blastocatellia bacterium]
MAERLINEVRIDQTRRELCGLRKELEAWLEDRRGKDRFHQYYSQLNTLDSVLSTAWDVLKSELQPITASRPTSDVYASCREIDLGMSFLRRVWNYYRTKFDQRDDLDLRGVLAAADDIVWSCYAQGFRTLKIAHKTAPLPYIEPKYSPQAFTRNARPFELQSDAPLLRQAIKEMPIPVVSLPPVCVDAPWWLIYLGHEIGHHIQVDLAEELGSPEKFRERLEQAAATLPDPGFDDEAAQKWGGWAQEIFADAFSVCMMGQWAVWAMTELEIADEQTMLKRKTRYPSPVVRLALLGRLADGLSREASIGAAVLRDYGLDPEQAVRARENPETDPHGELRELAAFDMKIMPKVADAIIGQPLASKKSFQELWAWNAQDFGRKGKVNNWAQGLRGKANFFPEKNLRASRLMV